MELNKIKCGNVLKYLHIYIAIVGVSYTIFVKKDY
jgi:hypothetical protein